MIKRLGILVRTLSPQWIRTIYRATRAFDRSIKSKPLPAELIQACRFCASRADLLYELPKNGIVAELGTDCGDFARLILTRTEPRELHLVDVDISRIDDKLLADGRVRCHRGLTHEVIAAFPDNYFDWVYVDADHSYAGTIRDARASAAKIRPGGYLIFNDFAHIDQQLGRYGVHRAVVDFAREHRWPLCFFAFDGHALYDVALQKQPR